MRKGLVDGIVNYRLGGVEAGESVSHLVDDTGRAVVANERQLGERFFRKFRSIFRNIKY